MTAFSDHWLVVHVGLRIPACTSCVARARSPGSSPSVAPAPHRLKKANPRGESRITRNGAPPAKRPSPRSVVVGESSKEQPGRMAVCSGGRGQLSKVDPVGLLTGSLSQNEGEGVKRAEIAAVAKGCRTHGATVSRQSCRTLRLRCENESTPMEDRHDRQDPNDH